MSPALSWVSTQCVMEVGQRRKEHLIAALTIEMYPYTTAGQHSREMAHPCRRSRERCGLVHLGLHSGQVVEETRSLLGAEHQVFCRNEMVGDLARPAEVIIAG